MAQVVHAAEALEDLARLVDFLEDEMPGSSKEPVDSIAEAVTMLGLHPHLGRRMDRLRRELVISHGKSGYLAIYRFDPVRDLVRILRIRHQREAGYMD